jgi:hypothetical protein
MGKKRILFLMKTPDYKADSRSLTAISYINQPLKRQALV